MKLSSLQRISGLPDFELLLLAEEGLKLSTGSSDADLTMLHIGQPGFGANIDMEGRGEGAGGDIIIIITKKYYIFPQIYLYYTCTL